MRLLLALAGLAALIAVAPAWPAGKPLLQVARNNPLTVSGSRFHPYERVTVTAVIRGRHVRKTTSSAGGRFKVRFRTLRVGRCPNYVITARGARGSVAILRIRAECAQLGP